MPKLTNEEIYERLNRIMEENAELKKELRILKGHLGLEDYWYQDLIEQGITPFCDHVKKLQERAARTESEEQIEILRQELTKKYSMKTKDVMALIGFRYYEQAKRLMKKTAKVYPEFVFENDGSKGQRIRVSKIPLNNVYTGLELNSMFKQN